MAIKVSHAHYGLIEAVIYGNPSVCRWYFDELDHSCIYSTRFERGKEGGTTRWADTGKALKEIQSMTDRYLPDADPTPVFSKDGPNMLKELRRLLTREFGRYFRTPIISDTELQQTPYERVQRPPVLASLPGDQREWDCYRRWQQDYLVSQCLLSFGKRDQDQVLMERLQPGYITVAGELGLLSKRLALESVLRAHCADATCY